MVVAANDMRDAHVVIIDDHGEHIGWRAVGPQQDEIVDFRVLDRYRALDAVDNGGLAGRRCLEPDDERRVGRRIGGVPVAPTTVIAYWLAGGPLSFTQCGKFLRRRIAAIGVAVREQGVRHRRVATSTFELIGDFAVPIEIEPAHPVQDGIDGRLR